MKKYYLMAIEYDDDYAMYNLGKYYHKIEKNYGLMKIYYMMAIDKDNYDAMFGLALYYEEIELNYKLMKKYYLMAKNKGHKLSKDKLMHYVNKGKKYIRLKKYLSKFNYNNKFNSRHLHSYNRHIMANRLNYLINRYINNIINKNNYYNIINYEKNLNKIIFNYLNHSVFIIICEKCNKYKYHNSKCKCKYNLHFSFIK